MRTQKPANTKPTPAKPASAKPEVKKQSAKAAPKVDHIAIAAKHTALAKKHNALADVHIANAQMNALESGAAPTMSDWGGMTLPTPGAKTSRAK